MNKKLNSVPSAGTEDEQRTADDVCSSPPAIANTPVVGMAELSGRNHVDMVFGEDGSSKKLHFISGNLVPDGFFETFDMVKEQMTELVRVVNNLKELGVRVECSFDTEDLFAKVSF